jgi:hypothetical protein
MEHDGLIYGHMVHVIAVWYHLYSFGILLRFGILYREKSGNPGREKRAAHLM